MSYTCHQCEETSEEHLVRGNNYCEECRSEEGFMEMINEFVCAACDKDYSDEMIWICAQCDKNVCSSCGVVGACQYAYMCCPKCYDFTCECGHQLGSSDKGPWLIDNGDINCPNCDKVLNDDLGQLIDVEDY